MFRKRIESYIGAFCMICLIGVMIILTMMMIFTSAASYEKIKGTTDSVYKGNTALCYVVNKIHAYDGATNSDENMVTVDCKDDISYICLTDEANSYKTIIYGYDGYIYENLMPSRDEFVLGKGNKIIEADGMQVSMKNESLINIIVTYNDRKYETYLNLNCKEGGNYGKKCEE